MPTEQVDELEYRDIAGLWNYWQNNPPTHVLVQGLLKSLGVMKDTEPTTAETPSEKKELSDDEFNELAEVFGFGG